MDIKKNECKEVIIEAGKRLLEMKKYAIEEKTDFKNLVTTADKNTQDFLVGEFRKIIPGATYLCEENDMKDISGEYRFIIDPIDGTSNFIFDYNASVISVALADREEILWGIIYNPFTKELYEAEKGKGAYLNGKRISVTGKEFENTLVGFGTSPYYEGLPQKTFDILKTIQDNCVDIRRGGSAALDLCFTAAGRLGLFFELLLQPWDIAAGICIIKEAGGIAADLKGREIDFTEPSGIVAGRRENVERFFELLGKSGSSLE